QCNGVLDLGLHQHILLGCEPILLLLLLGICTAESHKSRSRITIQWHQAKIIGHKDLMCKTLSRKNHGTK
ncbi:hypothetical protein PJO48_29815, partial [Mycobacterium kansasii]